MVSAKVGVVVFRSLPPHLGQLLKLFINMEIIPPFRRRITYQPQWLQVILKER